MIRKIASALWWIFVGFSVTPGFMALWLLCDIHPEMIRHLGAFAFAYYVLWKLDPRAKMIRSYKDG